MKARVESLFKAKFTGIGIVKKMVIGYFIIVFVPVIGFGFYYYNQLYESLIEEYASGKQQILEQAYSNLRMDLLQIESNYVLFQYNPIVIRYLNGLYESEWEYVYAYQKDISPLLSFALYGNSNMKKIRIYRENEAVFTVPEQIFRMEALPDAVREEIRALKPGRGKWFYNRSNANVWSLIYYQNLYAERFSKIVGVLAIEVDQRLERRFVETLSNERRSEVYVFPQDMRATPLDPEIANRIRSESAGFFFLDRKRQIVNHLDVEPLAVKVAVVSQAEDVFDKVAERRTFLLLTITALLLLLSGIYYALTSSVAKRLLRLARHMRNVGEDNFRIMDHQHDQDEIGYVTYSYNMMLQRIDDLVNKIQRSELLRKEAAYKVLQAQVKPHFLYNTLETIRMLAEVNDDHDVAEIAFSFGQLMRYSLSVNDVEVKLSNEIKNIDHYLNIHKMRLRKRLDIRFDIHVDAERIPCPRFILQPLVENCIVHGLTATRKSCRVLVKLHEDERYVYIEISDDGAGIPPERLQLIQQVLRNAVEIGEFSTDEGGHGLYNVSERIKAFYGDDSRLEVESELGFGTTFKLFLSKKGRFPHAEASGSR